MDEAAEGLERAHFQGRRQHEREYCRRRAGGNLASRLDVDRDELTIDGAARPGSHGPAEKLRQHEGIPSAPRIDRAITNIEPVPRRAETEPATGDHAASLVPDDGVQPSDRRLDEGGIKVKH